MTNDTRAYQPPAGRLLLLLRAALVPSVPHDGGPFLVIRRTPHAGLYRYDVQMSRPESTEATMLLLTGDDALAHADAHGWTSVLEPTADQLRGLMRHAAELRDARTWAENWRGWELRAQSPEWQERIRLIERGHASSAHRARLVFQP